MKMKSKEISWIYTIFYSYEVEMKAPTAPGRKLVDETLTWLNQGKLRELFLET